MSSEDFKHAPGALASIDNQGNLPLCTGFAVAKENYENTANISNPALILGWGLQKRFSSYDGINNE